MSIDINYSETRGPNVDEFLSPHPTTSCFIPICLYSFMANRPFLYEYIPWAMSKCEQPRIIIGDYMERHNIMAFEGLPKAEAIAKAERRGHRVEKDIKAVLSDLDTNDDVRVESCRVVIETAESQEIILAIRDYASKSECFNTDIEQQIALMLSNTKRLSRKDLRKINGADMLLLREYMIEEIAFFLALYQQGYTTEIYPGRDMNILQKMASARYRGFPFEFSERTHISVAVLLDSGTSYAQLDDSNDEGELK
ncbi:MAG: tRNA-dependent cyclodipeptide synthase [Candidatus Thiodiazotropha sp.]